MAGVVKRLQWRAEYAALRAVYAVARRLPETWRRRCGRGLGRFAFRSLRYRREVVLAQLRWAFPDRDDASRRELAERVYEQLGTSLLEFMTLGDLGPERIRDRVRLEGLEHLERFRAAGRGVLLTTGHFGNWELMGAALAAYGYPLGVVARSQSNPLVDALQNDVRRRAGMTVIKAAGSIRQLVRSLRDGGRVAMLPDVNAGDDGVFVPFLGRTASTPRGLAYFAWKLGCPIVPMYCVRQPDGTHVGHVTEPIEPDPQQDETTAVQDLTRRHTERLEAFVRRHPDHWFWVHRRWKTRPPEERP